MLLRLNKLREYQRKNMFVGILVLAIHEAELFFFFTENDKTTLTKNFT